MNLTDYLGESERVLAATRTSPVAAQVDTAVEHSVASLRLGRPLLVCGNGGSAADAMHITGELVGRFLRERRPYHAICLAADPVILTAWSNDHSYDSVFARQVLAHASHGGVLIGLSTSGNSPSIVNAFETARELSDVVSIAFTGAGGGRLADLADVLIDIPSNVTHFVQQAHICLYHYLCQAIEDQLCAADAHPAPRPR